jgi:glycosyltransferase involved in cell wall biosynthesis
MIMLKGYQGWAGRALFGLRALARCADVLDGYEVFIYSWGQDIQIAAELFTQETHVPTHIVPLLTPHEEILKLHGKARVSIGLSISDGISASLLEAMVMGAFPIQSWTPGTDEWITDGENGLLVPSEDPEVIEKAIRVALTDDELINKAAEINLCLATERLDQSKIRPEALKMYETICSCSGASQE